jgi:hypothetical protein
MPLIVALTDHFISHSTEDAEIYGYSIYGLYQLVTGLFALPVIDLPSSDLFLCSCSSLISIFHGIEWARSMTGPKKRGGRRKGRSYARSGPVLPWGWNRRGNEDLNGTIG